MADQDKTLHPEDDPLDSPDSPEDEEPDTVATPEGDNEFAPKQPLKPELDAEGTLQTPRGGDPEENDRRDRK